MCYLIQSPVAPTKIDHCQVSGRNILVMITLVLIIVFFQRETALLVDPENSSSAAKQWVGLVVGELLDCIQSVPPSCLVTLCLST